jgi:hypothetical protein
MINEINKEGRRSMNANPTRPSKNQWKGAQTDPKQKQDREKTVFLPAMLIRK